MANFQGEKNRRDGLEDVRWLEAKLIEASNYLDYSHI